MRWNFFVIKINKSVKNIIHLSVYLIYIGFNFIKKKNYQFCSWKWKVKRWYSCFKIKYLLVNGDDACHSGVLIVVNFWLMLVGSKINTLLNTWFRFYYYWFFYFWVFQSIQIWMHLHFAILNAWDQALCLFYSYLIPKIMWPYSCLQQCFNNTSSRLLYFVVLTTCIFKNELNPNVLHCSWWLTLY